MSGHSKWSNTKHRKASQDIKKGKIFTKITREIFTLVKVQGSNISSNYRLKTAIGKALSNNIPKNTLNRIINKAKICRDNLHPISYSGYSSGGAAVIVECLSNNKNKTTAEVRSAFVKTGGNLRVYKSLSYLFSKKFVLSIKNIKNEDVLIDAMLKSNVDDWYSHNNGNVDIYVSIDKIDDVKKIFLDFNIIIYKESINMIPSSYIQLNDDNICKLLKLIEILSKCNDVNYIYHNCKIIKNFSKTN
ncbi:MAG: YebC/PmpR family DNA-binding transcriptional regulator [Enterobacterales bacterium]